MQSGPSENMHQVETRVKIKLIPRSSKNLIVGKENDVIRIKVTAPPVGGKANKALIALLSKKLDLPKGNLEIFRFLSKGQELRE